MDAAVVGAVVKSIIPYLLQLIRENHALISGNYEKINGLSSDLRLLNKFMVKYTEEHYENDILMELAEEIRDLVHEVEDVLEAYIVESLVYSKKGFWGKGKSVTDHLGNLKTIGESVEKLSKRVDRMRDDNKAYGPEELKKDNAISKANQPRDNQRTDRIIGFKDAADEVLKLLGGEKLAQDKTKKEGLSTSEAGQQSGAKPVEAKEDEKEELSTSDAGQQSGEKLVEAKAKKEELSTTEADQQSESKPLKVVSIHGMLGLGKTTLANKVLTDPRVEYNFFTRELVTVSSKPQKKEVLLNILSSLKVTDKEIQNLSEPDLVAKVHGELKHKYLIVMDDVWEEDAWDNLVDVFPDNNNGSRVLITTRLESVATHAQKISQPYKLRFMEQEEAEELLRTKVFGENKCPENLQSIEMDILAKCDGLPLAIVVTAGILSKKPRDLDWWDKVYRGVPQLVREKQKTIDELIRLSYDNLFHKLKPCFLYLSVFPEDLEIQVSKVLRLWIAEGFIPQDDNATLEETAEEYFEQLVDRNLMIVGRRTLSGGIKTFRIHDTLRRFCMKTAKADLFEATDRGTNSSSTRRVCCSNSHFSQYIGGIKDAEKVRSLLSFGQDETVLKDDPSSSIFKPFKLLRVLDILSIHVKFPGRFPTKLPNLVLLKFIAIYYNLKILPQSMSKLCNLETLIVHTTEPFLDIKADIWGMTKLRHLHTNTTTSLPECKKETSSCENLQNLSAVSPQSLSNEVFERSKKLKKLGICGNLGTLVTADGNSSVFNCLRKLNSLKTLKLRSDNENSKLLGLPPPNKFPVRLTRLSLEKTGLVWEEHMPILEELPHLEVLKLKENAFTGERWRTKDGSFPSLKVLFIGATNLKFWEVKPNSFKELRCLVLKHCNILRQIPAEFKHSMNLEKIDLERTNKVVVSSAKSIKESRQQKIELSVYPPEW